MMDEQDFKHLRQQAQTLRQRHLRDEWVRWQLRSWSRQWKRPMVELPEPERVEGERSP